MTLAIYAYYDSPWTMRSGDDARIHVISKALNKLTRGVVAFVLSHTAKEYKIRYKDGVLYVQIPRRFYDLFPKISSSSEDLNPMIKLTHYVDEFIAAHILSRVLDEEYRTVYIFGSMTLLSFFLRILGRGNITVIYDPLANYAQTLYLRSRKSLLELIKYGLYIILHKMQLKSSDIVVYPSQYDLANAIRMFNVKRAYLVANPVPVCFESIDEYRRLRSSRGNSKRVYFILLAGGKGKGNEDAVKDTIETFNELDPGTFKLFITGPWKHMASLVRNPSIVLTGLIPKEKVKKLLAMSDVGLAPILSHAAGTFMKVLAYLASGLDIVTTPYGIIGLPRSLINGRTVYVIRDKRTYKIIINNIMKSYVNQKEKNRKIVLCNDLKTVIEEDIRKILAGAEEQ